MSIDSRKTSESTMIQVSFHEPVNNKTDYFFGSLKAIYAEFTAEEVGCKLNSLYAAHITAASPKVTSKCVIRKCSVLRIKQRKD